MPFLELTQTEYNMILKNRQRNNHRTNNNHSNYANFPQMFDHDRIDISNLLNFNDNIIHDSFPDFMNTNPNTYFSSQHSFVKKRNGQKTKSKYYKKKISGDKRGYRVFEDKNGKKSNKLYIYRANQNI